MRFISVRDLRNKSAQIWRDLPEEGEMVVTRNGRPVAVLTAVDGSTVEDVLRAFRQVRAVEAVTALERASLAASKDRLSDEEIAAEIALVREERSE